MDLSTERTLRAQKRCIDKAEQIMTSQLETIENLKWKVEQMQQEMKEWKALYQRMVCENNHLTNAMYELDLDKRLESCEQPWYRYR